MTPDRELLLERLERLAIVLDELMPQCAELVRDAISLLEEQEAVKPKTGHWFKIHGGTAAQCTICKCWGQINMKFCPWCGAKMET